MIFVNFLSERLMFPSLILLTLHAVASSAQLVANSVVEQPFVSCASDAIYAKWKTQQTFTGRVNVRYAPNRFCYQVLVTNNQVELLIPHLDCRISRIRSLDPPGLLLETTVLVSFHQEFVTESDRLFVLRCLHTKNATQNGGLNEGVPQQLTTFPSSNQALESLASTSTAVPSSDNNLKCSYVVVHDDTGKMVKSVRIGAAVRHEWECTGTRENQCLLVTNCFIKTVDSQHELIDEYGCSKDRNLVADLEYSGQTQVKQFARVFGVAEKPFVFYQCEMNLVDIEADQSCPRPKCSATSRHTREANSTSLPRALLPIFDVLSQQIEVLPLGLPEQWSEHDCPAAANSTIQSSENIDEQAVERVHSSSVFCMSWPVFLLGTTACSVMFFVTGVLLTVGTLRRGKYHDVAQA
ncbi:hypothetical protein M3Y97_00615700 [Aphelenchoides bicaudatus]|nr:hypothetical protein M3Y97_00615700 [Aphelenchoides bicaudatus]